MRKHLFFFVCFLIFIFIQPVQGQDYIKNSSITGVSYAGNKTNRIYIPPPDEFFKKNASKTGGSVTVYYNGFPSQVITAVDYAVSILESILPSDTRLTIVANWQNISSYGVLANSSITGYAAGWAIDALEPFAYYPAALAEKIIGFSLNDDLQGDIELTINSSITWYLGTDGNTSPLAYDLVTVVLHEIFHGLGFYDSMNTDGTIGWYGLNSIPMIYDTFIENFEGERLTDTLSYENYSTDLRSEITGGNLYFNGPLLSNYTSGSRARLYVPSEWDPGSSITHLDEDETPEPNTLMTPYIDRGEAIHDPGKYTFSILGDLGWVDTRIVHEPIDDTEDDLTEIALSVIIESDTLYNRDEVGLVYSYDEFISSDTIFLESPNSDNSFTATLGVPSYNTEIQYYFFVEDCFLRMYRLPSLIDVFRFSVYIGADTVKPLISHTPVDYYLETTDSIGFQAVVTDNKGVDSVYAEYIINDGVPEYIGLNKGSSDSYSATYSVVPGLLSGGDSIRYRIYATDSAIVPNTAILPETGYFVIGIEDIELPTERYSTDFSDASNDFLNLGFEISQPVGFNSNALHTKHPYESPEDNDKHIDYTALLRYPVKFSEYGMLITYKEIILVEPGEPGSVFGSDDFYDYVILEGSRDFGKTWFGLTDGFDSRAVSSWETAYNSSVVEMNSTFDGTESMMLERTVFYLPSDDISDGDTLLLRFRLYSDPFANGWGWVIEDFKINALVDAVEDIKHDPVKIYPNPGRGLIKISYPRGGYVNSKPVQFKIFNSAGTCLVSSQTSDYAETEVDISSHSSGMYIIVLYSADGIKTFKYTLIK